MKAIFAFVVVCVVVYGGQAAWATNSATGTVQKAVERLRVAEGM